MPDAGADMEIQVYAHQGIDLRAVATQKRHHVDGRFQNPFSSVPRGRLDRVLKWKLFSRNRFRSFYKYESTRPVSVDWAAVRADSGLSITYLKHATVLVKDVDAYILVDPVFGGLFGFIKDFSPLAFDPGTIPGADYILITHGHYDHLDLPTLSMAASHSHVITPLGYGNAFRTIKTGSRQEMDWYETSFDNGREFVFLPCNHWSIRNPFIGPNTGLWGSYVIRVTAPTQQDFDGCTPRLAMRPDCD